MCRRASESMPTLERTLPGPVTPKGHGKREGNLGPRSSAVCCCPHNLCQPRPSTVTPAGSGPPVDPQWTWRPSCLPSLSTVHLRRGLAGGVREPGDRASEGEAISQTSMPPSPSPTSLPPLHIAFGKENPRTKGSVVRNLCP